MTQALERRRALAIENLITFGANLTCEEMCEALEAVMLAWPAKHHQSVMSLGNRLCGMADAMSREAAQ